jgi:hypothetical protein
MKLLPIAVALLVGMSGTAMAGQFDDQNLRPCDNVPPQSAQRPASVLPMIVDEPDAEMAVDCQKTIPVGSHIYGCTFEPGVAADPSSGWVIVLNAGLTPAERDCTLLYERAHLPPNLWKDDILESKVLDAKP